MPLIIPTATTEPEEAQRDREAARQAAAAKALLIVALKHFGQVVVASDVRGLLMGAARQGAKGGEPRPAWMKLAIPDSDVKAVIGDPAKAEATYLLVRIPRSVTDEIRRQSESRIVPAGGPVIGGQR